jgi:hypothetical protein
MAHRRHHGDIVCNACAHLPAAGVVVSDSPVRVAAYDRVAAAVRALQHPVGVGAKGLEGAFRDRSGGHGENKAREGEAVGDACVDGLIGSWVSKIRFGGDWLTKVTHWHLHLGGRGSCCFCQDTDISKSDQFDVRRCSVQDRVALALVKERGAAVVMKEAGAALKHLPDSLSYRIIPSGTHWHWRDEATVVSKAVTCMASMYCM